MATPDATLSALMGGLAAALPAQIVRREFRPLAQCRQEDLEQGIVTLVNRGERGYANYLGREAQLGTLDVLLIGQLKVDDKLSPLAVEQAELTLAEAVKTFLQGPAPAGVVECLAQSFTQSGQLEAPFGWIVFELEVRGEQV